MSLESKNTPPAAPEGDDYLERRALRRGSAGWVLLTGLGVAYVVSGDYSGWNFGLAEGGFGGLAIAMVLMGAMYTCICLLYTSPSPRDGLLSRMPSSA